MVNGKYGINNIEDFESLNTMSYEKLVELAELLEYQQSLVMKEDFLTFLRAIHNDFKVGKHVKFLVDEINKFMLQKEKKYLCISMAPQHGKSMTVTESYPAYYLMRNPRKRVIIVGYNSDFATEFGRKNKDKIEEYGMNFNVMLNPNAKRNDRMFIQGYQGSIKTFGILSGVTGNPADLMIVDDPIKTREEANSANHRDKIWGEFLSSINTRLSAEGKVIIILTRWHEDDIVGRLTQTVPEQCHVINIPLEAGENDILGREPGDSLFPEIGKDKEWMLQTKQLYMETQGRLAWESIFQGNPNIQAGNMIKGDWFKYYKDAELPPNFPVKIFSVDAALKDGVDNDWSVIQCWGKIGTKFYLLDQQKGHWQLPELVDRIKIMYKFHRPQQILVEDKAMGRPVIDVLRRSIPSVIPITPKDGKITRVQAILGAIESGNVYVPDNKDFTYELIQECSTFPNGKHDDQVDAMSQALYRLLYQTAVIHQPKTEHAFADLINKNINKDNDDSDLFGISGVGGVFDEWN